MHCSHHGGFSADRHQQLDGHESLARPCTGNTGAALGHRTPGLSLARCHRLCGGKHCRPAIHRHGSTGDRPLPARTPKPAQLPPGSAAARHGQRQRGVPLRLLAPARLQRGDALFLHGHAVHGRHCLADCQASDSIFLPRGHSRNSPCRGTRAAVNGRRDWPLAASWCGNSVRVHGPPRFSPRPGCSPFGT